MDFSLLTQVHVFAAGIKRSLVQWSLVVRRKELHHLEDVFVETTLGDRTRQTLAVPKSFARRHQCRWRLNSLPGKLGDPRLPITGHAKAWAPLFELSVLMSNLDSLKQNNMGLFLLLGNLFLLFTLRVGFCLQKPMLCPFFLNRCYSNPSHSSAVDHVVQRKHMGRESKKPVLTGRCFCFGFFLRISATSVG